MTLCNCLRAGLAVALVGLPATALADDPVRAANTAAMGGAMVGDPADNSAITGSPGVLALARRYDGDGRVQIGPRLDLEFGASLMDSRTSPVAFGLTYRQTRADPPLEEDELPGWIRPGSEPTNRRTGHEVTLGLGFPLLERQLSLGLNATVDHIRHERLGPTTTFDTDLGIATRPHELFVAALTARNLLPLKPDSDLPMAAAAGVWVGRDRLASGALDVELPLEGGPGPVALRVGGEGYLGSVSLRAGYAWEGQLSENRITWGLGLENEAGAFEYAMAIPIEDRHDLGGGRLLHTISIRVHPPADPIEEPRGFGY